MRMQGLQAGGQLGSECKVEYPINKLLQAPRCFYIYNLKANLQSISFQYSSFVGVCKYAQQKYRLYDLQLRHIGTGTMHRGGLTFNLVYIQQQKNKVKMLHCNLLITFFRYFSYRDPYTRSFYVFFFFIITLIPPLLVWLLIHQFISV